MFSNFSAFEVEWDGKSWPTSEHAYQAAKFGDKDIRKEIQITKSPYDAKELAKTYKDKKRSDWNDAKLDIMESIVRHKLSQHEYIKQKLIETGNEEIIEDSPTDSFWGWGPEKDGENHLGKIWMRLREEIVKKT